jgi:hypothetical protein
MAERVKKRLLREPEPDPDVEIWRGKISAAEQVQRTLPQWSYGWITRDRIVYLALGAFALVVIGYFALQTGAPAKPPGELGLTFRYPDEWTDASDDPDWPAAFTTARSDLDAGGRADLVIARDASMLAVVVMPSTTETITAEGLRTELNTAELLYSLSTDSRVGTPREIRIMGETGYSVTAERITQGIRRIEEVVVLVKNGRVVHVLMSGPYDRWSRDRAAMEQLLR